MHAQFDITDTPYGPMRYPKGDVYIGKSLAAYGWFCPDETAAIARFLPKSGVLVDAGANIGAISVPLAREMHPSGMIYAFEPQPNLASLCSANLIENAACQHQVLTVALGAEQGTIAVPPIDYAKNANFGGISFADGGRFQNAKTKTHIPVTRLDDVIEPNRLDVIKADIELMEGPLLAGARNLISEFQPVLYLECDQPDHFDALKDHISDFGYQGYWHISRLFRENNPKQNEDDIFGNVTCVNLLCVPPTKTVNGLAPATGKDSHPKANRT